MKRLLVFLILVCAGPLFADDAATLTVSGTGTAHAAPDMARVSVGVQANATEAAVAMNLVSEALAGLLATIEAEGIAAADVQTSGLSLQPRFTPARQNENGPRVTGFQASNGVTLTVRQLDELGALLGNLVGEGANRLNGLSFDVADPAPLQSDAERAAMADARRTAEVLADAAGLQLGAVVSVIEGGGSSGGPVMRSMAMAESAPVPIAGGSVSRTASVTVTYSLVP